MTGKLVCWKCGASLDDLPLPLARHAECPGCRADLHVCRLCTFYDTRVAKGCREPIAELVTNKERANFCDYFSARPDAFTAADERNAVKAQAALNELFDLCDDTGGGEEKDELRRLFGLDDPD